MAAAAENLLGETIRKARERLGLTGDDIRRLADIHPTSLSFIERGQQNLSHEQIRRLAPVLHLSAKRLAVLALNASIRPRSAGRLVRRPARDSAGKPSHQS
jgi:transcriptional regulator with XRE-family HTH domain